MATMNISLPDEMKSFIEEQSTKQGFGTVSEYMRTLIREVQERQAAVDVLFTDGDDQPQVGFGHFGPGLVGPGCALMQFLVGLEIILMRHFVARQRIRRR